MSNNIVSKKLARNLLLFTLILVIIAPFFSNNPLLVLFSLLLGYTFIVAFSNFKIGLFLLLFVRPCLDYFSDQPFSLFNIISLNIAALWGIFTIFFALFVVSKNIKKIKQMPLLGVWALFLVITALSAVMGVNLMSGVTEWIRLLSLFSLLTLGFVLIKNGQDLIVMIKVIVFSAMIPATVAAYQFITKQGMTIPLEGVYNRIFGTFAHPNLFAYYLVMPILFAGIIFLAGKKNRVHHYTYALLAAALTVLLVLTYTRGAWVALLLSVFIIGIFRFRLFLAGMIFVLIMSYYSVPSINTRINDLVNIDPYGSIQWRINLWKDSIKYVKEKPILGFGTGTAKEIILKKRGPEMGSSDPHNDYLKVLLENGFWGLASYLLLIVLLLKKLTQRYLLEPLPNLKIFSLLFLSIALAFYIMSFADNLLRNTALQWSFWAITGGFFALNYKNK